MKNRKWFWFLLGIAALGLSVSRMATPYEMKVSDGMSKVAIDTALLLAAAIFGIICLLKFVKQYKRDKRKDN